MIKDQSYVFISYARADDEPFVYRLKHDLQEKGISVWWDRHSMESRGRTFLQEIRDAIEGAERIIAVIGPQAITSKYVQYEWEHAQLFAKGILPILRLGEFDQIPEETFQDDKQGLTSSDFSRLHCPDFRSNRLYSESMVELIKILHTPIPSLASVSGAPALPSNFIFRRNEFERLQDEVLSDIKRPVEISSIKQIVALNGMGGVGKSVLAASFARSIQARRSFEHGIIWLSVGVEANSLKLYENIKAVGVALEDNAKYYQDKDSSKRRLAEILSDKVVLIILDDVWTIDQTEPFINALGPRCRLLVTTRDNC